MQRRRLRARQAVPNRSVVVASRRAVRFRRGVRADEVQLPGQAEAAAQTRAVAPACAALAAARHGEIVIDEWDGLVVVQMMLDR